MSNSLEKRVLTDAEINGIISFIKPRAGIPPETAASIAKKERESFYAQLKGLEVVLSTIPELTELIQAAYEKSAIQAGESVGILMAQNIGEKQTQTTLNTFHKAGVVEKAVTSGVKRFEELLSVSKNPRNPSCYVRFKHSNESIQSLRDALGHSMVELSFAKIATNSVISCDKKPEPWYEPFKLLYNSEFEKYTDCITFHLNMDLLFEYKLTMKEIAEFITNEYVDTACVFSPPTFGQIDVFIDTSSIELPENRLLFINSSNVREIYLEEVAKPTIEKMNLCGIPGIMNIFFSEDAMSGDKAEARPWMIETDGTNLAAVMAHPLVDMTQTYSNSVWDIYKILGIEAARQYLIEEFDGSMSDCNAKLLSDRMTYEGTLSSISRYTMRGDDSSVLGKSSFEETLDNLSKAAVHGEIDNTSGVSASIMCGKRARIGTGMCELHVDVNALLKSGGNGVGWDVFKKVSRSDSLRESLFAPRTVEDEDDDVEDEDGEDDDNEDEDDEDEDDEKEEVEEDVDDDDVDDVEVDDVEVDDDVDVDDYVDEYEI